MAVTVSARAPSRGPSTPALIRGAGLATAVGIGLSLTEYGDLGKWITVLGVVLMIVSLHRFGRSGADQSILFTLPPRKKKKKKRASEATEPDASEPKATEPDA